MIKKIARNVERVRRHRRVREKISGTKDCPRVCIFRSNKFIEVQAIDDTKGNTLCALSTKALKLEHGRNTEAAIKLGAEFAKKCLDNKITTIVFDRGGYVYHGVVEAFANSLRENGLKF